jgi:regulator of protease activity HflC (stomatin/prohibitin superfamily)
MDMASVMYMLVLLFALLIFAAIVIASALRIVPEYQRAVIFRLGRCIGYQGPGLVLLIPIVDRAIMVDLREQTRSLPAQSAISADNVRLTVDISWSYKVIDPTSSVLQVGNFEKSLENIAAQYWLAQVESKFHQDVLQNRPEVRAKLLAELREASANWGLEITGVQLGEIHTGS